MNNSKCPLPAKGGGDCWQESHPASRYGLCVQHWRKTVKDWYDDIPEVTRRCPACGILNQFDPIDMAAAFCDRCNTPMSDIRVLVERHIPVTDPPLEFPGVVYYLSFGDRFKIGFSTDLKTRMASLPHDELLACEPGSFELEKSRHIQFSEYLVDGQREWFHTNAETLARIKMIRQTNGDPWTVAKKVPRSPQTEERWMLLGLKTG